MTKYRDAEVTEVRAAHNGDAGFDASKGEQVLIRLADGTEKVVLKSEVVKTG